MKALLYKTLLILMLFPGIALAATGKGKFTKQKKISKSYAVNANAGLNVASKYGNVYITTWDEDRTEIEVLITISGDHEDDVTKRLNGIDVDFEASRTLVAAKTRIENFKGKRISMEINYTIKIPKNGTIGINNQYGSIKLGKINGGVNLSCQYGSVVIDELNSDNNTLKLQYCDNSRISLIKNGSVTVQYSDMVIGKANTLNLNSQYGDVTVTSVSDLTYKIQYGDLTVRAADKITGSGNYSDVTIGTLDNLLNATTNYGDLTVAKLNKGIKNVSVTATYSDITIKYDEAAAFDFEMSGSYADISVAQGVKISEKIEKSSSTSYKGYYRSSGVARVYIKTSYGDIALGKN
jgi:hypothetical protein